MSPIANQVSIVDRVKDLGNCIELVSIDPHFYNISIGLFIKKGLLTIWTYSHFEGVEARIEQIRDRCVLLGDVDPVNETNNQLKLKSELVLDRALKFMFIAAVEKDPEADVPTGKISAPDTKPKLTFVIDGAVEDGRYVYKVSAEGESDRSVMRIRAAVGGFNRYADCVRVDKDKFAFPDGRRYDKFARLILPLARNISAVEAQLEQADMAGQMNTQTLGFAQS